MKAVKVLLGLLVLIVAVVAIVVVLVFKNLDGIIKTVVETVGSDVTQVTVSLDQVNSELTAGRIELHGFTIANPKGFNGPYLFDMDEVALQIEPKSLTGGVVVVNEVLVDGAKIVAELKGQSTNIQALQDNISKSVGSGTDSSEKSKPAEQAATPSEAADVRLMVEKVSLINNNLQLKTDQWGERTVKMPAINMNNLGDRKTGLTPEEFSAEIVSRLTDAAEKAVENELKELAKDKAKEELNKQIDKNLSDKDKEQLNQLKGLFGK